MWVLKGSKVQCVREHFYYEHWCAAQRPAHTKARCVVSVGLFQGSVSVVCWLGTSSGEKHEHGCRTVKFGKVESVACGCSISASAGWDWVDCK